MCWRCVCYRVNKNMTHYVTDMGTIHGVSRTMASIAGHQSNIGNPNGPDHFAGARTLCQKTGF